MSMEYSHSNATRRTVALDSYPGYPSTRLVIENIDGVTDLTLPDGPWSTPGETIPTPAEQETLKAEGYEVDGLGRPLHPWLRDMLSNPEIGVVTGKGEYWHWGPNRTADPVVVTNEPTPKILLIKRGDTGSWALPGGFIDNNEDTMTAAKRELFEEAGLILVGASGKSIYEGVVADSRATAHAWAETTAIVWQIEGAPIVRAGDDANDASWFSVDDLPNHLHGSHAHLINQALLTLQNEDLAANHVLSLPHEIASYHYVDGGHMAYHHIHATTTSGKVLFIKSHDKQLFSDPVREAHSKQYLHKEKHLFDHLSHHGFNAVPAEVILQDNHTLIMDAFSKNDGWRWNTPENQINSYVTDTLKALDELQTIPLPLDFRDTLLPTYETHKNEGWQSMSGDKYQSVGTKLTHWMPKLTPAFQIAAADLVNRLPELKTRFELLSEPTEYVLSHHDFRQANMAWHPVHGTKIVDWSWAGVGRENSDATTFLIDLHKSGHDVSSYMNQFNPDHALTLIGFWLAHSLWPTRDGDATVRFHQAVSAVAAYDLLEQAN